MYFHNGNHIKTLTFHNNDCNQEFVYVSNLSEDHYLYNENPYLLVTTNGIILAMDHRTSSLELFTNDHTHIDSYSFTFITTCNSDSISNKDDLVVPPSQPMWIVFVALILLLLAIVIIIKKKGNHNEN